MAAGQKSISTAGVTARKFDRSPLVAKVYDFKVLAQLAKHLKSDRPGAFPYIELPLEALGSGTPESPNNKRLYTRFWLSCKPGKDGVQNWERASQLNGFAKGFGMEANLTTIVMADEGGEEWDVIDPEAAMTWLKQFDGRILKAKVQNKKEKDQADPKNTIVRSEIEYFVEGTKVAETVTEEAPVEIETVDAEVVETPANGKKKGWGRKEA